MSNNLHIIVNELKRLKVIGVDRVFVEDQTLRLLTSQKKIIDICHKEKLVAPLKSKDSEGSFSRKLSDFYTKFPQAPRVELIQGEASTQMKWLNNQIFKSEICQSQLEKSGKLISGAGSLNADILFCGDAPGVDEALEEKPFTGKSGTLLTKIITAMGLSRESTYLTYLVKWHQPHKRVYEERSKSQEKMACCLPYFTAEIEIIKPKVIVALGNSVANDLLGNDLSSDYTDARGSWHTFFNTPLIITFHPEYLLRNDTLKAKRLLWEDMLKVMEKCGLKVSKKQLNYFLPKI